MHAIEEIRDVAKTMATVASAKLSRTRSRAAGMRVYTQRMREILRRQQRYLAHSDRPLEGVSPLFVSRPTHTVVLVHLAGDRGMCGNYNVAINRLARTAIERWRDQGLNVHVAARGGKGTHYLSRHVSDLEFTSQETWPRTGVTDDIVDALHDFVLDEFRTNHADEVWCTYTRYYAPVRREPVLVRLLPIAFEDLPTEPLSPRERWSYEPTFDAIVDPLVSEFVRLQCEDVLLESYASEQGARMITMEEATERAGRRLHECRVLYNRLRREHITTDLLSVLFASQVRKKATKEVSHGPSRTRR